VGATPGIERAGTAQLDEACRLFTAYQAFYGKAHEPSRLRDFLAARLQRGDSVVFIARIGDDAVGLMQLYPSFASLSLAPSWILNDLFVAPHARGRGVAEALMAAARALAERTGAAEIFLQTAHDNRVAQRLYERLGYRLDEDFRVYTLSLPTA
jgi:ribosomal protein S18 acetylase RimI-like enzyme